VRTDALTIDVDSARAPTSLGTGTHLNPKSDVTSIDYDGWGAKKNVVGQRKDSIKNPQDSLKQSENGGAFNFDFAG
jgi:hypothetical protein